jgi:phosphoribosylformylglycinamidine cyclo-ligase
LLANCSLIGGETAEHPKAFPKNKYDLAGFCVGVIEKKDALRKKEPKKGDLLIGIESSGLHSNGFSLIRKLLDDKRLNLRSKIGSSTVGKSLLRPTKIYVKELLALNKIIDIKSMAHITGGGLTGNLKRIIPKGLSISLISDSLFVFQKKLFTLIKKSANLSDKEMLETFNCGYGMVLVINKSNLSSLDKFMKKNKINYNLLGEFISSKGLKKKIIIEN